MRAVKVSSLVLVLAVATQAACTFRGALGSMVTTTAGGGVESVTAPAATGAAAAVAAAETSQQQGGEFRWSERVEAGRVIEIKNVNGHVRAEGASGSEVEVVATKTAQRSDPESVRVEVVRHAGGVTICAVYPDVRDHKPNRCAPGREGNMSVNNNDVRIDFTVRVPAGVLFTGRTVNGGVEAAGIRSDVEAYTVNGGVRVAATGLVRAQTVNGGINVEMGRADWQGEMEFETVNGGIDLLMPASLSADVRAETLNGQIRSDFPMSVQGNVSRRKLEGVVGAGGRALSLKTVNGNVVIRRAS